MPGNHLLGTHVLGTHAAGTYMLLGHTTGDSHAIGDLHAARDLHAGGISAGYSSHAGALQVIGNLTAGRSHGGNSCC